MVLSLWSVTAVFFNNTRVRVRFDWKSVEISFTPTTWTLDEALLYKEKSEHSGQPFPLWFLYGISLMEITPFSLKAF